MSPPVAEAFVRVVFPVTSRVPPIVSLPVTVDVPIVELLAVKYVVVRLVKSPVIPVIKVEKKLVDVALDATRLEVDALMIVALVVVELPTIRLVMFARVATRDAMKPLVEVEFVVTRLVMSPLVP